MASIIFYGAGRNAHEHFNDWKAQGLIPVCFLIWIFPNTILPAWAWMSFPL